MADALRFFSYKELVGLIICIVLDGVDYAIPILSLPLIGDLLDVVGLMIAVFLFGWVGVISLFEFVPGLDFLPMSTVNWFLWLFLKRSKEWAADYRWRFK